MSLFPDTATRRIEPELMDDPSLAPEQHRIALRGLARINAVSLCAASIWSGLRQHLHRVSGRARVLDVACGGGDVAVSLQRLAARTGVRLTVDGCDLSETAVGLAAARAGRFGLDSSFFRHDALAGSFPSGYDAVISSLFLHHLSEGDAVMLLRRMGRSADVVVVNDLARGPLGYAAAVVGTRLLSRSPVVRVDGPRSVRGSFTVTEARALASRAGLERARVKPVFPWRWQLDWVRR